LVSASSAVIFFLCSIPLSSGRLRWYLLLGVFVGFFLWKLTLGRLFLKISLRLVYAGKRLFRAVAAFGRRVLEKPKKIAKKII
jgi:hypothetical protein